MDLFPLIVFSIISLMIIGCIIYLSYDYMTYKKNVDMAFETTTNHMNDEFTKVASNIDQYDSTTSNLEKMDTSLKKYFRFYDNDQEIKNKKIYDHVFSGVCPNLDLLAHINTVSGIVVNTSEDILNDQNLKVCNKDKNCIHLNVNNDGFNITPDSVDLLTINSKANQPLARFDLKNDSIYLGGGDINSPFFIQDGNVFVNNINMILKEDDKRLTGNNTSNLLIASLKSSDLKELHSQRDTIETQLMRVGNAVESVEKLKDQVIIYYNFKNREYVTENIYLQTLVINVVSSFEIKRNSRLIFDIPILGIFTGRTKVNVIDHGESRQNKIQKYILNSNTHDVDISRSRFDRLDSRFTVTFNYDVDPREGQNIELEGYNIFENTTNSEGTLLGEIVYNGE